MEGVPSYKKNFLKSDIITAWQTIDNGVVEQNNRERQKYWNHWTTYTKHYNKHPFLTDCSEAETVIIITAFAARVRTGIYGRHNIVKVQTLKKALAAISKTIELTGQSSPIYKADKTYKVPVARLIEGFHRTDPPPTPQIAIPVIVVEECLISAYKSNNPFIQAQGDLSVTAFFYLLRVGEYTKPKQSKTKHRLRTTRTVQFQVANVGFFKKGKIMSRHNPLHILLTADSCTLKITNQKNGRMGETIHQHATNKHLCPVKAMARRVNHILQSGGKGNNLICDVYNESSTTWDQISPTNMIKHLRTAVTNLKLDKSGIHPDLVGVHSFRAGGAMALKLNGADDTTIMKMGRWTSLTFLQYIHNQIAHLSQDLSTKMSTKLTYQNIAAIEQEEN